MNAEFLFDAIGRIGADLVDSADHTVPAARPWRRWLATAAVMALLICGAAVALPRLVQPAPVPDPQQALPVSPIRTTMVLEGKIYYVDDHEEMPDQNQLKSRIAGEPLELMPEHTGSSALDQAVLYPTADTEQLILRLEDGFHTARTYGEFHGMEFGYKMASASSFETLLQVFVEPIERFFPQHGLRFSNPSEVNDAALMMFWPAMLHARDAAGIRALEIEERQAVTTHGTWSYSAEEIREILDQYLAGHSFSFTTGEFVIPAMAPTAPIYPVLREVAFDDVARKMILQVDVYGEDGSELLRETTYTVQFTGNTYRYLSILDRRPDQPSDGMTAPENPAD